jgi:hypothetical protein
MIPVSGNGSQAGLGYLALQEERPQNQQLFGIAQNTKSDMPRVRHCVREEGYQGNQIGQVQWRFLRDGNQAGTHGVADGDYGLIV